MYSGTYSAYKCDGGSNGAHMRFPPECDWGANAGLRIARDFLVRKGEHDLNINCPEIIMLHLEEFRHMIL